MLKYFTQCFVDSFCRASFEKNSRWQTAKSRKAESELEHEKHKGILCASCQTQLARHDAAMEFAGAHYHCFTNPAGIDYRIALYREIVCQRHGALTEEYSWFAGYGWQVVLCPSCHIHLGWRFMRVHSPDFYGLITDRIVET